MAKLLRLFLPCLLFIPLAALITIKRHDSSCLRDIILQHRLESDLKTLAGLIAKHQQSPLELGLHLQKIEDSYTRYPRLGLQLVDLFTQINQWHKANTLVMKIGERISSFSDSEIIFFSDYCLAFYKTGHISLQDKELTLLRQLFTCTSGLSSTRAEQIESLLGATKDLNDNVLFE